MRLFEMSDEHTAEGLCGLNAHMVLCRLNKRPLHSGWQRSSPSVHEVKAHLETDGLIGVIPASVGMVIVDVDRKLPCGRGEGWACDGLVEIGTDAVIATLGQPIRSILTRSGGQYLVYRGPSDPVGNKKWRYGDVRHASGYVIVWDLAALLDAVEVQAQHAVVDISQLPKPWPVHSGPALVALTGDGERSNALNRQVFQDARYGCLSPDAVHAYQLAGETCGLAASEVRATIQSARKGARRTTPKPRGSQAGQNEEEAVIRGEYDIATGFTRSGAIPCGTRQTPCGGYAGRMTKAGTSWTSPSWTRKSRRGGGRMS